VLGSVYCLKQIVRLFQLGAVRAEHVPKTGLTKRVKALDMLNTVMGRQENRLGSGNLKKKARNEIVKT